MASHSRFTEDIWCTPLPGPSQIPVRTINELKSEIFQAGFYDEYQLALFQAEEMKSKDLYEKYVPNFRHKNKQYIFERIIKHKNYSPSPDKKLLVTRWKPFLPEKNSDNPSNRLTQFAFIPDVFQYEPTRDENIVEWYLNFANDDLFAYYSGPLLAQDELQVLECIELAALREYFVQTQNTVDSHTIGSDKRTHAAVPTPILISNAERVIKMDTSNIYGNAFAKATERQIIQACHFLPKPQTVNLIAIEAPSGGRGAYTRDQVKFILQTCYTGFKAAQILANKTRVLNSGDQTSRTQRGNTRFRTKIHTGWWGCGAYGNNRQMMILTQMLAASWNNVDELVFHTQTNEYKADIDKAQELFDRLHSDKNVEHVIDQIVQLGLQWDRSNNT